MDYLCMLQLWSVGHRPSECRKAGTLVPSAVDSSSPTSQGSYSQWQRQQCHPRGHRLEEARLSECCWANSRDGVVLPPLQHFQCQRLGMDRPEVGNDQGQFQNQKPRQEQFGWVYATTTHEAIQDLEVIIGTLLDMCLILYCLIMIVQGHYFHVNLLLDLLLRQRPWDFI